jgi:pimeloyl-ACP methyl ester carboxylesterase
MRAILVGKTSVGMRTTDLLACFDYLAARNDVDHEDIGVFGKDNGGIVALYAAALEPRISRTVVEGAFLSYLDVSRARFYEDVAESVVPGILKEFDLPDVAAAIAPRGLWIVRPRMPSGAKEALEIARSEYAPASRAYAHAGAEGRFRILDRPGGRAFSKLFGSWPAH